MNKNSLKIALIDDHYMLSQSLASLLSKYEFIGEVKTYTSPKEFLASLTSSHPDIIVSDIMMPEMSGIELLEHLKSNNIHIGIIILSSITEVQTIRHALRNGASGFLSKGSAAEELADALLAVNSGEPYIGESLRKTLLKNTLSEERFKYSLSPREKEVLQLVCSGRTIKETANEMGLSSNTVQTYHKAILKKFNLNRTADLIVFAIQNGLFNPHK